MILLGSYLAARWHRYARVPVRSLLLLHQEASASVCYHLTQPYRAFELYVRGTPAACVAFAPKCLLLPFHKEMQVLPRRGRDGGEAEQTSGHQ